MSAPPSVLCFGEILWDCFPQGKRLGGAPFNVAAHLAQLGVPSGLISSVGDDPDGRAALEQGMANGIVTDRLAIHPHLPTGTVKVSLNECGDARYEIAEPVAWDEILVEDAWLRSLEETVEFLVFGTLALRSQANRNALDKIRELGLKTVCDVNLRPPFDRGEVVDFALDRTAMAKLNDEELQELTGIPTQTSTTIEAAAATLAERYQLELVCVTRGSEGACLYRGGERFLTVSAPETQVRDTVGAGDAFLAGLIAWLVAKEEMNASALEACCALGALVASRDGAVPRITDAQLTAAGFTS
jgi:fructokinase